MYSFRETIKDIVPKLLEDVQDYRIFNEADMQYRAAHHLDKICYPADLFLTNQPVIPVGQRRGKTKVKPDIVVFDHKEKPVIAVELKCFIGNVRPRFSTVVDPVWRDIGKLREFRKRYKNSTNAFAIVLVNVEDKELFAQFQKEFSTDREEWMKHYLFIHLANIYCDENGRKRRWHDDWRDKWYNWQKNFSDL